MGQKVLSHVMLAWVVTTIYTIRNLAWIKAPVNERLDGQKKWVKYYW